MSRGGRKSRTESATTAGAGLGAGAAGPAPVANASEAAVLPSHVVAARAAGGDWDPADHIPPPPPGGWDSLLPPITGRRGAEPLGGGLLASGAVHGALIGLALFGTAIFQGPPEPVEQMQEVELISAAEFDAKLSRAPQAPVAEVAAMAAPMPTFDDTPMSAAADVAPEATTEFIYGDVTDQEQFPDLSAVLTGIVRTRVKRAEVSDLAPAAPSLGAAGPGLAAPSMGMSSPGLRSPASPGGGSLGGMRRGASSLGISTNSDAAPPPPPPDRQAPDAAPESDTLARADEAVEGATPDPEAAPDAAAPEEAQAAAPEAASEEKITEADRPEQDSEAGKSDDIASDPEAPVTARLPVARPTERVDAAEAARLAAEAEAAEEAERQAAEAAAAKEAEQKAAEAAAAKEAEQKAAEAAAAKEAERKAAEAAAAKEAERKAAEAAAAKEAERKAAEAAAAKAAEQKAAAAAAKEAAEGTDAANAGAADVPVGAPLTSGEIGGLKSAISKRWNTSMLERLPNYRDLVVTMRIRLDQAGRIVGEPEMISSSATGPAVGIAAKAARDALKKAQPFNLPAGKYGRWREIEVTFNPGSGVSM
ncbi:hypothetical protein ACQ5SO_04105 [Rhodovulum sp. DZ06]|uniref:hypothetical protein n=1 Tax=Rhodovulum sp. DZ06 TaxID=3425126 RepID=UPI003D32802D